MQRQIQGFVAGVLDRDEKLTGRRPVPSPLYRLEQQRGLLSFAEDDAQSPSIS